MTTRHAASGERGQILVLFTLVIVLVMGLVALAVDVGVLRNASQNLWNALDAGALAGASQLPDDGVAADALANQFLQENYPDGIPTGNVTVSFRCLIGSVGGSPRLSDVPAVCDPGPGAVWTSNSSISVAICNPGPPENDQCNTIVVSGEVTVPYGFGPAIGVNEGSTGTVTSAACKGPCGSPPENPVDIVLIVDRTQSMNGVDTANARAASHSVRTMLNPAQQWLGYSMLGPSNSGACITRPAGAIGTA
ncbi:MAG TPA: pilus assembly protein TadG-related protein, partial [Candidatus Limnocylindrales bacterium]